MKNIIKIYLLLLVTLCSCNDPYENTTYQIYEVNPASTYLDSRSDEFSGWIEILKYADLYNAVNQANQSFTVFVPDNAAVAAFYKKKGVNSITDLGEEYARSLVRYHIIRDSINYDTFMVEGKLEKRTLSDDYLSVSFKDEEGTTGGVNSAYINKEAHVAESAIRVSNGYIYVLNTVLSPLVETVYERINEAGKYTIFDDALVKTSWKDSLNIIYDEIKQPNSTMLKQRRDYTVLAVSDEVFKKDGISSITDLIAKLNAGTDYKSIDNELYRYIAYHINKGTYSLLDLWRFDGRETKKLWSTMSDAVLEISKQNDGKYYINYGGEDKKAMFLDDKSDVAAKNGMLHELSSYLPVWQSEIPQTVYFDFCDYNEVASYIKSYGTTGQVYQQGHATTEYRTNIENLACYKVEKQSTKTPYSTYNPVDYFTIKETSAWKDCMNKDQLILNLGYMGSIAMKTPVIITGKYKVTLKFCYAISLQFLTSLSGGTGSGGKMEFSFDGDHKKTTTPYTAVLSNVLGLYDTVVYEELEFTKTGTHEFKIVVTDPAASTNDKFRIQLDYLLFEPIINE